MRLIIAWILCHLVAALLAPAIWRGVAAGYPGDSFWTLPLFGQVSVVSIAFAGMMLLAMLIIWKTQTIVAYTEGRWPVQIWLFDSFLGVLIFAVLFSLSAQVFYSFYQVIIPDLPDQQVVSGLINWDRLKEVIVPRNGAALADHVAAIGFSGIVLFTAFMHRPD